MSFLCPLYTENYRQKHFLCTQFLFSYHNPIPSPPFLCCRGIWEGREWWLKVCPLSTTTTSSSVCLIFFFCFFAYLSVPSEFPLPYLCDNGLMPKRFSPSDPCRPWRLQVRAELKFSASCLGPFLNTMLARGWSGNRKMSVITPHPTPISPSLSHHPSLTNHSATLTLSSPPAATTVRSLWVRNCLYTLVHSILTTLTKWVVLLTANTRVLTMCQALF